MFERDGGVSSGDMAREARCDEEAVVGRSGDAVERGFWDREVVDDRRGVMRGVEPVHDKALVGVVVVAGGPFERGGTCSDDAFVVDGQLGDDEVVVRCDAEDCGGVGMNKGCWGVGFKASDAGGFDRRGNTMKAFF